jgi:hypothetical protein
MSDTGSGIVCFGDIVCAWVVVNPLAALVLLSCVYVKSRQ